MSDRPWWAPAIQWGAWLVMSLVMAWVARGPRVWE